MKKFFAVILTLVLAFSAFAYGESAADAVLTDALKVAESMCAGAAELSGSGFYRYVANQAGALTVQDARAAAVVEIPNVAVDGLCAVLGCEAAELSGKLNESINGQYSEEYVKFAGDALYSYVPETAVEAENTTAVLVLYDYHIALVIFLPDGSVQGVFMMSDKNVLSGFGAQYVTRTLESLGITGVKVSIYREDKISALIAE